MARSDDGDDWLNVKQVTSLLRIGRATLFRWVSWGRFPPPVKLSPRYVRWRRATIEEWLRQREHESTP